MDVLLCEILSRETEARVWIKLVLLSDVLGNFSLVVVLIRLVKHHGVNKPWVREGCLEILVKSQHCNQEETDGERYSFDRSFLKHKVSVVIDQRYNERYLNAEVYNFR